jgi:hypothetical protein
MTNLTRLRRLLEANGQVTRQQLMDYFGYDDKKARDLIYEARTTTEWGAHIYSSSGSKGYRLESAEKVHEFLEEQDRRARTTLWNNSRQRALLPKGQMELGI